MLASKQIKTTEKKLLNKMSFYVHGSKQRVHYLLLLL